MRRKKRLKKWLIGVFEKPIFYFCLFFIVINMCFTKQILDSNGIDGFIIVTVIEVLIEILSIWVLVVMKRRGMPLEKRFLFLAIILGVLFIALLPPGQSPDEVTHFKRVYGISDGFFVPEEIEGTNGKVGSEIPVGTDFLSRDPEHGTYSEIVERIDDSAEQKSTQIYTSAALYSFICYIPQTLAALVGKMLGLSVLGMAYLMEVFNFIIWLSFIYFAIKFIPRFKSVVMFLSLLPITIQEATSLSPDALTIGLCVFFVSFVLNLAYGEKGLLSKKEIWIIILSSIVLGFCKIVYLPLALLLLVIPKERFKTNKQRWVFLIALYAVVAVANLIWLVISSRYLVEIREGVDSKEQLFGILKNPFRYLMVMFRTANTNAQIWTYNLLGMSLGAFKFNLPNILFFISFAIMLILFAQRDETLKIKKIDRWIFVLVFFVITILIFTSLYMQWTPYGEEVVDGIQGRYFLPIMLLISVMICRTDSRKNYPVLVSTDLVMYYSLFINVIALVTIFAQNA